MEEVQVQPVPAVQMPVMDEETKLKRRRNKVLAWIFLLAAIFTLPEIAQLFSPPDLVHKIGYWFDVVYIIPTVFFVVQLFRQKEVLKPLLYVALFNSVVSIVLVCLSRDHLFLNLTGQVLFALFFVYYIIAPLTKKNSKISYFILLPLFVLWFVLVSVLGGMDGYSEAKQYKATQAGFLEFIKSGTQESAAFSKVITEKDPGQLHQELLDLKSLNDDRLKRISDLEDMINSARSKTKAQKAIDQYDKVSVYLDQNKKQAKLMGEFIDYGLGLDFEHITKEQGQKNIDYINRINGMTSDIIDSYKNIQ